MYGTVAKTRVKPENREKLQEITARQMETPVAGYISSHVLWENDSDVGWLFVIFEDRESYDRNADDPAQNERYHGVAGAHGRRPGVARRGDHRGLNPPTRLPHALTSDPAISPAHALISSQSRKSPSGARTAFTIIRSGKLSLLRSNAPKKTW